MFDEVYEGLYVGEVAALKRQADVHAEGITAVVRLDQISRDQGQWDDRFVLMDCPIPDGESLDGDVLTRTTRFIYDQIEAGGVVLVHCHLGVSRSVTVAMAYLIAYEGMSLAEAFGTVREGRASAYPHEALLVSLIQHYRLPFDITRVHNPRFLAELATDV
jgi:protein-tyrosine phosphatase